LLTLSLAWDACDRTAGNYIGRTNAVPSKSELNQRAGLDMKFPFSVLIKVGYYCVLRKKSNERIKSFSVVRKEEM